MISLKVCYGRGDRPAGVISDELIANETMAKIRAEQELAAYMRINKDKTLSTPHDPTLIVGVNHEYVFSRLGIFGQHLVTARSVQLENGAAHDTIEVERYGAMMP